jgi:transketolase
VQSIANGNDLKSVEFAIRTAQVEKERPSLIIIQTHIGFGSPNKQDTCSAHGSPLGEEEVRLTKENLGWPMEPSFLIPEEAQMHFRQAVDVGENLENEWKQKFSLYEKKYPELAAELLGSVNEMPPLDWDLNIPEFPADSKGISTREASGKIMQILSTALPNFMGGSADLNTSTYTELKDAGNFESPSMAIGYWRFTRIGKRRMELCRTEFTFRCS